MLLTLTATLLAAANLFAAADFIIANTTACYGAFPMNQCSDGAQVITDGVSFTTSFTCDKLYRAQDHQYIDSHSAGPDSTNFTSTYLSSIGNKLYFDRNYTTASTNGTFDMYKGVDVSGDSVGQCEYLEAKMYESKQRCGQLLGVLFFVGAYRCNTTVLGPHTTTEASVNLTTTTSTSSASSTSIETTSAASASTLSATSTDSVVSSETTTASSDSIEETTSASESSTAAIERITKPKRWFG